MSEAWRRLELLREYPQPGSRRQRVHRLLSDVAMLALFPSTRTFWRGHSRADYHLEPSLLRIQPVTPAAVRNLLARADRAALYWRQGIVVRGSTELERLSLLQHTGTPTPLLDLTADPLVALYFAAQKHDDEDGLLIGFNADMRWEEQTLNPVGYEKLVHSLKVTGNVGWLVPPVVSDRVVVQRARLMISPVADAGHWASSISKVLLPSMPRQWSTEKLEHLFADAKAGRRSMPPLVGLLVHADLKKFIREAVDTNYGISHPSMFPEPEGFARA